MGVEGNRGAGTDDEEDEEEVDAVDKDVEEGVADEEEVEVVEKPKLLWIFAFFPCSDFFNVYKGMGLYFNFHSSQD